MSLNFKKVGTILKYSCRETVFKGREHCQRAHYVQYVTAGHAEEITSVPRTTTTWQTLRMQMERTASEYEGYLNVH
jgi:hypothetical protein